MTLTSVFSCSPPFNSILNFEGEVVSPIMAHRDWANINHSHGSAKNFPLYLKQLTSSDKNVREDAFYHIREYSNHQGTIYEVTPYVVPFLLELVASHDVPDRHRILRIIHNISASCRLLFDEDEIHTKRREIYKTDYPHLDYDTIYDQYRRTYHILRDAIPLFEQLLTDADASIKMGTVDILDTFWRKYEIILPILVSRIHNEADKDVRSHLVYVVCSSLAERDKFFAETRHIPLIIKNRYKPLLKELVKDEDKRCRFQAVLAISTFAAEKLQRQPIYVLEAAILTPSEYSHKYHLSNDFMLYTEVENACDALCTLPQEVFIPILSKLLKQISHPEDAHVIAVRLLDVAFLNGFRKFKYVKYRPFEPEELKSEDDADRTIDNSQITLRTFDSDLEQPILRSRIRMYHKAKGKTDLHTLTDLQREILQTVTDTEIVWMLHSNILVMYGLPAKRATVQNFLSNLN